MRIPATLASLSDNLFLRTALTAGGAEARRTRFPRFKPLSPTGRAAAQASGSPQVRTVEHLLAALEACGVDNARIELMGTGEARAASHRCAPRRRDLPRPLQSPSLGRRSPSSTAALRSG